METVDNLKITLKSKQKNKSQDSAYVWKECLRLIKQNVSNITYNTWFLPIKPYELEDDTLKIQVPNNFFIEWIEEHYNTLINTNFFLFLQSKFLCVLTPSFLFRVFFASNIWGHHILR